MRREHILAVMVSFFACYSVSSRERVVHKTYEGPDLPAAQEVVLHVPQSRCGMFRKCSSVAISYIDGKKVGGWYTGAVRADDFRFLPGKHTLTFVVVNRVGNGFSYLWFAGDAGKSYSTRIEEDRWGFSYKLWIQDDSSGLPVGGIQGSEDEPNDPPQSAPGKATD